MLQQIRDKSSGWIAFVILGLVIITMAFFGIESYFTTRLDTYSAKIEGPARFLGWGGQSAEVSQDAFRQRFEQVRAQERERLGEAFDANTFETLENKRLVLDAMIDEQLLALVAERDGLTVSEDEVAAELKASPQFQVNGAYNADQYRLALASQNLTHAQFMASMRQDMARRLLPGEITGTALSSDAELEAFLALAQQKRDLQLLELPTPSLPEEAPAEADLKAWYENNTARYRIPEKVAIEYVELDAASLPPPDAPDEATLRETYEAQKSRFYTEPQRSASHILVAVPADADEAAVTAAREKAQALVAKAREAGADFAAIARESSDDVGSKAGGGDLGVINAGDMPKEFEDALFALTDAGQVTEPVRTTEGWHVIQLRELVAGSGRSFEDVRQELENEYMATAQERVFSERAGQVLELIYKTPTALAPVAEQAGLTLQRTPLFTRQAGEGVAAIEAVRRAAFADNQRIERQVSDTIEIAPGHVVALHVIEHQPESTEPFEAVKDRVLADYNAERLEKAAVAQAEALLARARAGESMDALATEVARPVVPTEGVTRQGPLPPQVTQAVFGASPSEEGKPAYGIAAIAPDRQVLFAVVKVTPGDVTELDDQTRALFREQFARARGMVEYQDFVKSLRRHYTVTVAEDRL